MLAGILDLNPTAGMAVCVVFIVTTIVWNIRNMKKEGRIKYTKWIKVRYRTWEKKVVRQPQAAKPEWR